MSIRVRHFGDHAVLPTRDAAAPTSLSAKIIGELDSLSDGDLRCIANDASASADSQRRERALLVLQNRRQKEFWSRR